MSVIGIEEIFLDVKDLGKAIDFYEKLIGIPVVSRTEERRTCSASAVMSCCRSRGTPGGTGAAGRCTSPSA